MDKKEISEEKDKKSSNEIFAAKIASVLKEYAAIYMTLSFLICTAIGYYGEYKLLNEFGLNITVFAEIDDFFLASLKYPNIFILTIFFPLILIFAIYLFSIWLDISIDLKERPVLKDFDSIIQKKDNLESNINNQREKIRLLIEEVKNTTLLERFYFFIKHPLALYKFKKNQSIIDKQHESLDKSLKEFNEYYRVLKETKLIGKWAYFVSVITLTSYLSLIFFSFNKNLQNELDRIINNPILTATVSLRNKTTIPDSLTSSQPLIFITATNKFMFFYQYRTKEKTSVFSIPISSIESVQYSDFKIKSATVNN